MAHETNKMEFSCGGVVFADTGEGRKYLLIRSKSGFWGFPKGHMEAGETEEQTARREVREETGSDVVFLEGFRASDEYPLTREGKPDVRKQVTYFLARCEEKAFRPLDTREVAEARLMTCAEADAFVYSEGLRRILAEAERFLNARQENE